ncbi:MAG: ABC transporter ATP-binding protein [Streptosporangiaceae bacterium]
MNAIAFTHVSKTYGVVRAVDDVSLTIGDGETVALLGPNGAGKSTTVSLLVGLARPSTGEVRVFDDAPEAATADGLVGAMLQDGALVPGLTVRELVDLVRGFYPKPMPLDEALRLTGLVDVAGRRTDKLSGGQKQRLRFALAVAGRPRLLVLDEPTAAMDVESRRTFWSSMRGYAAGGRTILFATHYLEEADEHADRVVVLARGRVVADGTSERMKAAVSGRSVRFTLGDQSGGGLDTLPGVTAVEIRGETAALRTIDADATVGALYASGVHVRDLEVSGADLEDAFLALTGDSDAL